MSRNTLFLALLLPCWLAAQKVPNLSPLTIEQIMQGEKFVGYSPSSIFWSEDGKTIYFSWNPEMDTLSSLYKIGVAGGRPEKVSLDEQKALPGPFGVYNTDRTLKAYVKNGDLFLLNLANGATLQITNTIDRESSPQFSGDYLVYQSGGNAFTWNRKTGATAQLTDFRRGSKREDRKKTGNEKYLEDQQMELFDVLRERKAESDLQDKRDKALDPDRPMEYYYGDRNLGAIAVSPNLEFVTFRLTRQAPDKHTEVPNYVSESGYTEELRSRDKVGSPLDSYEFGIYDAARDTVYLLDTKQIPGIYDKPEFLREYYKGDEPYKDQYDKPREVMVAGPVFSTESKAVVVVRSLDSKDRWIMLLDLPTGTLKLLDRQRDEAWIGGPGIGWSASVGNIGWMPDQKRIWFQSEETGFSQLYTVDVETGERKALTSGKFEVLDVNLSNDQQTFYITANAEGPHEVHFYRLPVAGGKLEKITGAVGNNEVTMSPDEQYLAVRYSYSNKPWELYLMDNRPGAEMKQLTSSTTAAFNKYKWRDPEIVWFKASDGVQVPARIYRPAKPKKGGAAVVFVHGAGYLQNVHKWWSSYFREYMFHNLLADNGYTVLDIDYRASQGYGRDWRTAIYRYMGGKDLSDQVDGAKFLVDQYGIDKNKIGIYGGSYGGFMTLMAMFNSPGTFKCGAALRSVTDWAHYNHGYTANILNQPQDDSIAYYRSSPINFASGLRGKLLMLHGMVDTNVHFQDIVRLSQRLIELGKDNWELAVFPVENHGFAEPSSWTDEYKRIFRLFQENLR
ncbi:MAG: prolyl oligopeptidase family serine peptidase [Lewinella sp.]|nr:prolyl oligopeptidase family serine peptidase [Lewinella sp.]